MWTLGIILRSPELEASTLTHSAILVFIGILLLLLLVCFNINNAKVCQMVGTKFYTRLVLLQILNTSLGFSKPSLLFPCWLHIQGFLLPAVFQQHPKIMAHRIQQSSVLQASLELLKNIEIKAPNRKKLYRH